jgi:hypothetical protein
MGRKRVVIQFNDLIKAIRYAYENATGDELPEGSDEEMAEFLVDDLGLNSIVEYDEEESVEDEGGIDEDF